MFVDVGNNQTKIGESIEWRVVDKFAHSFDAGFVKRF